MLNNDLFIRAVRRYLCILNRKSLLSVVIVFDNDLVYTIIMLLYIQAFHSRDRDQIADVEGNLDELKGIMVKNIGKFDNSS